MPLILGILVIIVAISYVVDGHRDSSRTRSNTSWDLRKTNCQLECKLYCDLIYEQGISLQDAIPRVTNELIQKGFVPCVDLAFLRSMVSLHDSVPPSSKDGEFLITGGYGFEHFDSYAVNNRKKILKAKGLPINDETVYADFPKNWRQYNNELLLARNAACCVEIGTWITYSDEGPMQVIGYNDQLSACCCKDINGKTRWVPVRSKLIRR